MSLQLSVAVRNARADAIETVTGASARLKIRTSAVPATCATADAGTVLADITLPADWMSAASAGVKSLLGSWTDATADATGTAQHARLYAADGTTCHAQWVVGVSAADMIVDSVNFTAGQSFTINSFTITEPNG